ncbi:hypothetical protein SAMN05444360_1336 [Chryseobacterium carnipullorum]|uniref:hypothetical protein n=1 Tax=Chryseobacterium carnipullorum TaxID=1124835 RepID=UPI000912CD80|nr:hypothetical protein [Chryseobacterium carnipullorum]SHN06169.1 hypothetical protein SAMN05444360_1336 [Chryseobacterium carnipullorum]
MKLKCTSTGIIYVKQTSIINIKRPNSLEGAKVLGKPVILNVNNVVFLSHNSDGHVTFFMQNGFEISINIFFSEAEQILISAIGGQEDGII